MKKQTITRERLEEWVAQFDEDGSCDATDSQLEALIRQSLAAMTLADGDYMLVPKVPSQAHLNSIAMRYRHDFYLLNDAQKDNALATARQMYEECSGQVFYTLPAGPKELK
ncbi:hypothetical protein AMN10_06915 [Klebsiella variicola]|nr:hypothetical protein [Klebsiella variicola]QOV59884.1 hypothetical protein AMN10_06915 [Klebsiella variicola]CEP28717.1 hypothetical protein KV8917_160085 [Klebsiella variicola]